VIDLDLRSFFDSLDHRLVLRAVAHHTSERWILLYVQRWLKAPLAHADGTLKARDRGSPQGSAISPLLANMFLAYALDLWLVREFPGVPFERYAHDVILHCNSKPRAHVVLDAVVKRLALLGLEVNPGKTRIVYCKDSNRIGSHEHERFGIRARRASCTARTPTASARMSTSGLISWATRFARDQPWTGAADCSSASARRSPVMPRRRSARRSDAGGCTCRAA
jgi:hypothetical protein